MTPLRLSLIAAAALIGLVGLNYAWSAYTFDQMLDSVEATEAIMEGERQAVNAALDDAGVRRGSDEVSPGQILVVVKRTYADLEVDLTVEADPLRDVLIPPWWRKVEEARADYLEHVDAWTDRFKGVRDDPSTFYESSPAISSTFRLACAAMQDAVPTLDLFGAGARVDDVCAE